MAIEKITIEPVPEGFSKLDGTSVEDVLKILEEEGISTYFVFPSIIDFEKDRQHTIILNRADYHMLMKKKTFGDLVVRADGLSYGGFFRDAKYSNGQTTKSETTQLRLCMPSFAPQDTDFLEANGIRLVDAMRPYEG